MEMTVYNRFGLKFVITEENGKTRVSYGGNSILLNVNLRVFLKSWYDWRIVGQFVQDAFSYLSADEREFLQTGLTPKEFEIVAKEFEK